jgi:hypothetical protein
MKLSTSLVAVKKVISFANRADYEVERIEELALQILKAEGIISPLILRRKSLDAYEVVENDFGYYAAVRAREIDPRKGELISAIIIDSDNPTISESIVKQIELLSFERNRLGNKPMKVESDPIIKKSDSSAYQSEFSLQSELNDLKTQILGELRDFMNVILNELKNLKNERNDLKNTLNNVFIPTKSKVSNPNIDKPDSVNIKNATRDEIYERLNYLSNNKIGGFGTIDSNKAADAIFNAVRSDWKNFTPITKLKCKIGESKILTLDTVFTL